MFEFCWLAKSLPLFLKCIEVQTDHRRVEKIETQYYSVAQTTFKVGPSLSKNAGLLTSLCTNFMIQLTSHTTSQDFKSYNKGKSPASSGRISSNSARDSPFSESRIHDRVSLTNSLSCRVSSKASPDENRSCRLVHFSKCLATLQKNGRKKHVFMLQT